MDIAKFCCQHSARCLQQCSISNSTELFATMQAILHDMQAVDWRGALIADSSSHTLRIRSTAVPIDTNHTFQILYNNAAADKGLLNSSLTVKLILCPAVQAINKQSIDQLTDSLDYITSTLTLLLFHVQYMKTVLVSLLCHFRGIGDSKNCIAADRAMMMFVGFFHLSKDSGATQQVADDVRCFCNLFCCLQAVQHTVNSNKSAGTGNGSDSFAIARQLGLMEMNLSMAMDGLQDLCKAFFVLFGGSL